MYIEFLFGLVSDFQVGRSLVLSILVGKLCHDRVNSLF